MEKQRAKTCQELAVVKWTAEDIQTLRPEWSEQRCIEFLGINEDTIQSAMIERGWDVIDDCLRYAE
jgi:hypothetical protein